MKELLLVFIWLCLWSLVDAVHDATTEVTSSIRQNTLSCGLDKDAIREAIRDDQ